MPAIVRLVLAALLCGFCAAASALDANTATQDELETIRGIGPALSARIVDERSRRPFRDLADFQARVRGVGETNLRAMRAAGLTVGSAGAMQTITGRTGVQHIAEGDAASASASASGAASRVQYFAGHPRDAEATAAPERARGPSRSRARGAPGPPR